MEDEEEVSFGRAEITLPRNIGPLSIEELLNYIALLESEIVYTRAEIVRKEEIRGGAESLFRK